jgi:hypothetical protein
MNTTFFSSVARHNLERFHSECLAWMFNEEHELAEKLIQEVTEDEKVEFQFAFTEVQQLDLVLYYKSEGVSKAVIIENKIKAAEGRKMASESELLWVKNLEDQSNPKRLSYSQTEYYFLRTSAKKYFDVGGLIGKNSKELNQFLGIEIGFSKNQKDLIQISKDDDCCTYVYLIPAKIDNALVKKEYQKFDFERYNNWSLIDVDNPWKTISYKELCRYCGGFKTISDNQGGLIKAYGEYLIQMASDLEEKLNGQFEKYNPSNFGTYEYFRVLRAALFDEDSTNTLFNNEEDNIIARPGSSNNGEAILDIYLRKKIELKIDDLIEYVRPSQNNSPQFEGFTLGIQVQGSKVKLFLAADNYENIKVKDKEAYAAVFRKMLGIGEGQSIHLGEHPLKKALPKGKSFMDYYFTIPDDKKSFENMKQLLLEVSKKVFDLMEKSSSYI